MTKKYGDSECLDDLMAVHKVQNQMIMSHINARNTILGWYNDIKRGMVRKTPVLVVGLAAFSTYCYEHTKWPHCLPLQAAAFIFTAYHINSWNSLSNPNIDNNLEEIEGLEGQINKVLPRIRSHCGLEDSEPSNATEIDNPKDTSGSDTE